MSDSPDENRIAYEQLLAQHRSSIEQECLAYQSLQGPDLSYLDLVQEVTMRVWQRIAQFRGLEAAASDATVLEDADDDGFRNLRFEAWLRKTTRSILNNLYRDRKTQKRNPGTEIQPLNLANEAAAESSSASSIVVRDEEFSKVRQVLDEKLEEMLRSVVILHIHQHLSFADIAERLGLTYDQVRHKYRTALKQLESELDL